MAGINPDVAPAPARPAFAKLPGTGPTGMLKPVQPQKAFRKLAVATFALLAACADELPATSYSLGGFQIKLHPDTARVTILGAGGRPLLEGLDGRAVRADGPPLTGFAVREFDPAYEMHLGSFKPVGEAGPWQAVRSLNADSSLERGLKVVLNDKDGDAVATLVFYAPERGHLRVALTGRGASNRQLSWGYACNADDHFVGFGAQTWDVDHRGFNVPIWVEEEGVGKVKTDDFDGGWLLGIGRRHSSYLPVPQYYARRGYALVAKTDARSEFDLCARDENIARLQVELPATIHVFDGPTPAEALARASFTFGRPRMPPDFAFGPWNDAIGGSAEVRRIAQKLRAERIPSTAMWTEDYADFQWDLNTTLYPDFKALAADLHATGYKFLLYFQPFVYKSKPAWKETAPKGYLIKKADGTPYEFMNAVYVDQDFQPQSLIDLTNPDAREWAMAKMRAVIELGADGWMGDFAEWLPTDAFTHTGTGLAQHNRYPVQWQALQREVFDGVGDGVDRLFFARSGYLGTPPLVDVVWGGDQSITFEEDDGFPTVLPIGIGLGVVGISTFGSDIAGYLGVSKGSSKELWLRWVSLGAWSPVMRTHHGYTPAQNWNWEKDAESTAHLRRNAELHMALFPYWKGLAAHAHATGMPIWRGLALSFPDDPRVWPIKDEVMVGERLLLAPVLTEGATARTVYLPEGKWFAWDGFEGALAGSRELKAPASVTEVPVFARAGAIVPMFPSGVMTLSDVKSTVPGPAAVGDDRVLRVFLGAPGHFEEAGGKLSYALAETTTASAPAWNGKPLAACQAVAVAPCVRDAGSHAKRVWLTGPGTLTFPSDEKTYALDVTGGSARRTLDVTLRY